VSKATAYRQRFEFIDDLTWPDGGASPSLHRRFDAMLYRRILNEPAMQLAKGEFGGASGSGVD